MKATGIVRKVDELGRIVIPKELRKTMDIAIKDGLEIYTEDDSILLKKHLKHCCLCGETEFTTLFKGKLICNKCIDYIKKTG